jgi:hypothetical protein
LHLPSPVEAASLAGYYATFCDRLVLQGGADIGSTHSKTGTNGPPDADRDPFELAPSSMHCSIQERCL